MLSVSFELLSIPEIVLYVREWSHMSRNSWSETTGRWWYLQWWAYTNTHTTAKLWRNEYLISVDITVYHREYHGDLNETFLIGNVSDVGKKLVQTTWECLQKAIEAGRYISSFYPRTVCSDWSFFVSSTGWKVSRNWKCDTEICSVERFLSGEKLLRARNS